MICREPHSERQLRVLAVWVAKKVGINCLPKFSSETRQEFGTCDSPALGGHKVATVRSQRCPRLVQATTHSIEQTMATEFDFRQRQFLRAGLLIAVTVVLNNVATAQTLSQQLKAEPVETLAKAARQQGNAVRGAIVLTNQKLSCTRCHSTGEGKPVGPDLRQLGSDVTDAYLIEALLEPSKTIKKGFESVTIATTAGKTFSGRLVVETPQTVVLQLGSGDFRRVTMARSEIEEIAPSKQSAMPDNLVDQLGSRDQFLDLVRYLMELSAADKSAVANHHSSGGQKIAPELHGLVLIKEFNCSACHKDDLTKTLVAAKQAPDLLKSAGKIDPHFMQRFIAEPLAEKPVTTMPDVMSGMAPDQRQTAAKEITHYLASLNDGLFERQTTNAKSASRGRDVFHTVGCVACHSPRDNNGRELLAETSVPLNSAPKKYNVDSLVAFLKNPLESRPSGRMPNMSLSHWEATDVAHYLLDATEATPSAQPFEVDESLAAKGKGRFKQLGCGQCHHVEPAEVAPKSMALSSVRLEEGCLSGRSGNWPTFSLSAAQRDSIRAALSRETQDLSRQEQLGVTLTAFRCLNCHQRDELGGASADRNPHFQTTNQNLGPQGRIPPTLTGVGAKLNAKWMRQVLVSGRAIRPYVLTRMPQYGTENVEHLVDLFQEADELPAVDYPKFKDQKEMRKVGGEMVGTGGLNCIVCHTFQLKKAANMPAVDLTQMAERLQQDWFYHYMRNPQQLSRNTIMPSFWPGGRAMRRDILDGDRDMQIEAIWQYPPDGRQARTPRGLIREPLELLATDEAVMLRRSYPGIGKRGIGVGYPNQVNLAYDAEQMRLAMIWKGKFADPGGVWRSQGHGRVRPLGDSHIQFAPGPDVDHAESPWVVDGGRPPDHQFKGYSLDEKFRPQFKYRVAGVNVEDYSVDLIDKSTGRPFIRRTLTLESESDRSDLAFRAATGKSIVPKSDGQFLVDDRLTIRIGGEHTGKVVNRTDGKQLEIPVRVTTGEAELTLEYRW